MKEVGKNKNTHSESKLTVSQYESFVLNQNPRFYIRFFFLVCFVFYFIYTRWINPIEVSNVIKTCRQDNTNKTTKKTGNNVMKTEISEEETKTYILKGSS